MRSTSQGGAGPSVGTCENASSSSWMESLRASSMRGAWLVGPTNRPENRYDSEGWLTK